MILFGFKSCGKTTFGKLLADAISTPFVDTDRLIEEKYGAFRPLIAERGVEAFRALEREIILSLTPKKQVISIGGGTILCPKCRAHLSQLAPLIYLRLDRKTLFERMLRPPLPYFIDPQDPVGSFESIYCQRIPEYEKIPATLVDMEGKSPQEILWQLIDLATSFASPPGESLTARR